ncbi:hypothetical protein PINS_up001989 [Pythium insidiosum]|nr:hypothetical protein PINS_up001989 [Pythium insidiosum]
MSLGFLTESALLPSKAKAIKVDSESLVGLKAVIFQKEQERRERQQKLAEAVGGNGDIGRAKYALLKGRKRKSQSEQDDAGGKNRGVEKRSRRDEQQRELDVDNSDDDDALQRKSREMLAKKAQLYEMMVQGKASYPAADCLIDFEEKRRSGVPQETAVPARVEKAEDDSVEIVDEFGRTRTVVKGSSAHLAFMEANRPTEEEKPPQPTSDTNGGFVVSQWETTLSSREKEYLRDVHARVERAKDTSDGRAKKSRKQQRLEKLRQQMTQGQVVPTTERGDQRIEHTRNDDQATAQATEFLNQMSSML